MGRWKLWLRKSMWSGRGIPVSMCDYLSSLPNPGCVQHQMQWWTTEAETVLCFIFSTHSELLFGSSAQGVFPLCLQLPWRALTISDIASQKTESVDVPSFPKAQSVWHPAATMCGSWSAISFSIVSASAAFSSHQKVSSAWRCYAEKYCAVFAKSVSDKIWPSSSLFCRASSNCPCTCLPLPHLLRCQRLLPYLARYPPVAHCSSYVQWGWPQWVLRRL